MTRSSSFTVLVVGGGAREHALAWSCARSSLSPRIICCPGNAGTAMLGENVPVAAEDSVAITRVARERDVDLVVIGPDGAAAAGVADRTADAGIAVFGPTAAAARLETSKLFAKKLMQECDVPTASWLGGDVDDHERLLDFAMQLDGRCVVKADGLALGKGVTVCDNLEQAREALQSCLVSRRFGSAGERVVVEELLSGREVSVFVLTDGKAVRVLTPACDYKRAGDGDTGPNTGGMGAYAPPAHLDVDGLLEETVSKVVEPCLAVLEHRGTPFVGCLYVGLMLSEAGLRVLEFNCRFGDPEAQVVLPLLEEDAVELLLSCARGTLPTGRARTQSQTAVAVVAATADYPSSVERDLPISGVDALPDDVLCFHSGTRRDQEGTLRTSGGRVLTMVGHDHDASAARAKAYGGIAKISFPGMRYRSDIAEIVSRVTV